MFILDPNGAVRRLQALGKVELDLARRQPEQIIESACTVLAAGDQVRSVIVASRPDHLFAIGLEIRTRAVDVPVVERRLDNRPLPLLALRIVVHEKQSVELAEIVDGDDADGEVVPRYDT